mmetsp:Transcript_22779/g.45169  ORF Transcript_22779/g.45169 Transcript_22779/m.45169 type:complete len:260 (+) Transcript_22779:388-1167(+)
MFSGHTQWDEPIVHPDANLKRTRTSAEIVAETLSPISTKRKCCPATDLKEMATTFKERHIEARDEWLADSRSNVEGHPVYYADEDADVAAWRRIQVSSDVLSELQRALYERQMSPALVALLTFGLRTPPWQHPSRLLTALHEKFNSHDELWQELRCYREAMEPKNHCSHQSQSPTSLSPTNGPITAIEFSNKQASVKPCAKDRYQSEMTMVREAMAFVVTRLQMLHDHCESHKDPLSVEHQALLSACLRLWWSHASRHQ